MIEGSRKDRFVKKKIRYFKFKTALALLSSFILLLSISLSAYLIYLAFTIDEVVLHGNIYPSGVFSANETAIGIIGGSSIEHVPLEDISPYFINAVISVEDNAFFSHPGINPLGIARAMYINIRNRRVVQGGSTITQQLAKNIFLTHERTLDRKLRELVYTLKLERRYSKNEILEAYLNNIYYGHGNYGIKAASNFYFRKEPHELTLAEAALLAGIIQGPYLYTPFRQANIAPREGISDDDTQPASSEALVDSNPRGFLPPSSRTFTRRSFVLSRMVQQGFISPEEADKARQQPVPYTDPLERTTGNIRIPQLLTLELERIENTLGLETGQLRRAHNIYTTLDENVQLLAQQSVRNFRNYLREDQRQIEGINSAIVAIDPHSGAILAMAGKHVDGIPQPGSSFKPIVYALALESQKYTLISQYYCTNIQGFDPDNPEYNPSDFSPVLGQQNFHNESLTMRRAIRESCNIYALLTNRNLDPGNVVSFARTLGYNGPLQAGTAMALGTSGVNMLDMASVYSVFANGGYQVQPFLIREIRDRFGNIIYRAPAGVQRRVISEETAFLITDTLRDVLRGERGTANSAIPFIPNRDAAVKTGSTNAYAFMAGFTPEIVVMAYVGYDIPPPNPWLGITGGRISPLWANFTNRALNQMFGESYGETFIPPPGIIQKTLCRDSLLLATASCPNPFSEYFIQGTGPETYCNIHQGGTRIIELCIQSWKKATDSCPPNIVRRFSYRPGQQIPTENCHIHP